MPDKPIIDYKKIYEFYRITFVKEEGLNAIGDCPFCGKDAHLSVHTQTGQFRCFVCGSVGNVYSFFQQLLEQHLESTTMTQYRDLADLRGLTAKVIKACKWAYDSDHRRWLVPFYNGTANPHNLGVFWPSSSNPYRILKSPQLPIRLYRPFSPKNLTSTVYVFEGEWNVLAAKCAFEEAGMKSPSLVSTSGATTWTADMNSTVQGKKLVYFFDNDRGGEMGRKTIMKKATGFTYAFINWPETIQEESTQGKDVRDLWIESLPKSECATLLTELADNATVPPKTEAVTEVKQAKEGFSTDVDTIEPVPTYSQFMKTLHTYLYLNDDMRRAWEMLLACSLSIYLPDKPLWAFLVGAPSSGKSELINTFGGDSKYFKYTSRLTSEGMVSGWKGEGGDPSLLDSLNMTTLFIGDLTVILTLSQQVQEKLWGMLRELYGGTYKANYGNQEAKEYHNHKFCMIAGVTHAIYTHNNSDMGERFLRIDYTGPSFDEDAHMSKAAKYQHMWDEVKVLLRNNTVGYFKHLAETVDFKSPADIKPNSTLDLRIRKLAKLAARLRTKVQKDRYEGVVCRPHNESPTRIYTQLRTLAKALVWVKQETEVTEDIFISLKKVAFASCPGLGLEVVQYLNKYGKSTQQELVRSLQLPSNRIKQILTDFKTLGIVELEKMPRPSMDGRTPIYCLSQTIKECFEEIEVTKKPKFTVPKKRLSV